MRRGSHSQGDEGTGTAQREDCEPMSGGEPSSIKQNHRVPPDLPILSPKCGKAAGCVYSNYLCAVLWGAERKTVIGDFKSPYIQNTVPEKPYFDTRTTPPKAAGSG